MNLYTVNNITNGRPGFPITQPMTLIETEVEIQKMLADPFHGVILPTDEDGAVHGTLYGEDITLIPTLWVDPDAPVEESTGNSDK